jgi:hypothetical protein
MAAPSKGAAGIPRLSGLHMNFYVHTHLPQL